MSGESLFIIIRQQLLILLMSLCTMLIAVVIAGRSFGYGCGKILNFRVFVVDFFVTEFYTVLLKKECCWLLRHR